MRNLAKFIVINILLVVLNPSGIAQDNNHLSRPGSQSDSTSYLYIDSYDFKYLKTDQGEVDTLIGNVKIVQDSLFLSCQRAIVVNQLYAQAVGNVVIIHNDSIRIYADSLIYDGLIKVAWLYGEVILEEGRRTLHTNELTYYVDSKQGFYEKGGTLLEGESRLISKKGSYNAKQGMARFKTNVTYMDSVKQLRTDSLEYDYKKSRLHIVSPTRIFQDTTEIYCEGGIYDIENDNAVLSQHVQIKTGSQSIKSELLYFQGKQKLYSFYIHPEVHDDDYFASGDTITYQSDSSFVRLIGNAQYLGRDDEVYADIIEYNTDSKTYNTVGRSRVVQSDRLLRAESINKLQNGSILASGKVVMRDTIRKVTIKSEFLEFQDSTQVMKAYNFKTRPLMILTLDNDSLYLIADTLVSYTTTSPDSMKVDHFSAYNHVEFVKSDIAGKSDSLSFNSMDSTFTLFAHSYIWSDSTQMTADSIKLYLKNSSLSRVDLKQNALVIIKDEGGHFNQIRGNHIENKLSHDKLKEAKVNGNTELLYFVKNDNEVYVGINATKANQMKFSFEEDQIEKIRYYKDPESKIMEYDSGEDFSIYNLSGYNWAIELKPSISLLKNRKW